MRCGTAEAAACSTECEGGQPIALRRKLRSTQWDAISELLARRPVDDLVDVNLLRLAHGEYHHSGKGIRGNSPSIRPAYVLGDVRFSDAVGQLGCDHAR